jgi:hypothetical protein
MPLSERFPSSPHPGDPRPGECLVGDLDVPLVAEFIREELLRGTIRTLPAGRGRVLIIPSDAWSAH